MLVLLVSIASAVIPEAASWRAAEREHHQQSIFDDQQISTLLQQACTEGHRPSCKWKKYREKKGHTPTIQSDYFTGKCTTNDPWSCVIAGWKNSQLPELPGYNHPDSINPSLAVQQFTIACDNGAERGCVELAKVEINGEGVRQQSNTALQRLRRACEQEEEEGCYVLGILHNDGIGVPQDAARAQQYFQQSCDAGLGKGCAQIAFASLSPSSSLNEIQSAIHLFKLGCSLGSSDSCHALAQHFEEGIGVPIDQTQVAFHYDASCRSFNIDSCDSLGVLYAEGRGVDYDISQSIKLFEQACQAKNPLSCYNLAVIYEQGQGVDINLPKARALSSRSCIYGSGRGCFTFGLWQEQGTGGEALLLKALQSYGRGCELGYPLACINGGIIAYQNSILQMRYICTSEVVRWGALGPVLHWDFSSNWETVWRKTLTEQRHCTCNLAPPEINELVCATKIFWAARRICSLSVPLGIPIFVTPQHCVWPMQRWRCRICQSYSFA